MIRIRELEYEYKLEEVKALKGVNLEIGDGRTTIIGHNGCGKTTLLKCIAGILQPDKGSVAVEGIELNEETREEIWKKLVVVPQNPDDFLISSTVEGEIDFSLRGMAEQHVIEKRVRESIEKMGLGELKDKVSHRLSTGEKKKVALAIGLAVQPEVLLADEPTANLDSRNSAIVISLLSKLVENGIDVVITTNNLETALAWGGHLIMLKKGEVIAEGGIELLYDIELLRLGGLA